MAWICDKNGNRRCEIKQLSYSGTFMEVSSITVTVESAAPIAFAIGDYIDWDYDGLRYTLDAAAGVEKQARRDTIGNAFVYENLVFLSPLSAAGNADFLDVVLGNTNEFLTNNEFSFYGTAWDYAKRLEANLCRLYGSGSWKVRIWTGGTCYDTTPATDLDTGSWESKLVDVASIKCLGGFQQIYDTWGCAYVFSVVGGVNYVDFYDDFEQYAKAWKIGNNDKIFAYGKNNGLYKIRQTPDSDHVLVTRLRAYGSSDNLPANYYLNSSDYHVDGNESSELAISHLMLPASQWTKNGVKSPANAYLEQNTGTYGVREATVCWDGSDPELGEIKPTIYGVTIQQLLELMSEGATYRPNETKWPDTTQRIDKIVTGAAPVDNGAVAESGYDFTEQESTGSFSAHSYGGTRASHDVEFNDLVMGSTPSVSHLAEFRIVPTSDNKVVASFDLESGVVSQVKVVTAYITPYVDGVMMENATYPCKVEYEGINNTVGNITYTRRYKISLLDSAGSPIVFSTMRTGAVTFSIRAHVDFNDDASDRFSVIKNEHAVSFKLIRGNKAIDKFFSVAVPQVGFDLAAAVSSAAKLCMRSGANQPREFPIVPSSVRYMADTDTWYLRCKRVVDQSTQTYFPNSDSVIAAGDEYYFAGIAMPTLYVEIAASKLLAAASAWLERHSKPRMLSSVDVDNKIMAVEGIVLKEGMSLPISDTDLGIDPDNQESRIIDSIRIEETSLQSRYSGDRLLVWNTAGTERLVFCASDGNFIIDHRTYIRTFSITLRSKKEKSSLDAAIRGATKNLATNASVSEAMSSVETGDHGSLSGRDMPNQHPISSITGLESALAGIMFFEEDGNGGVKLKDQYTGISSPGHVVAHVTGSGGGGGGGGGGLIDRLYRIADLGGTFNDASNDTFNAYTINSLHTRISQLEAHPGGVSSVAGLTGTVTAPDLFTALGLGAAATKAVGAVANANTGLVTGGDVYSFVNSSIATATATFRGTNSTATTEADFLIWANALTHDLNDYVFWATVDAAGNTVYKRYKYNGSAWAFEYDLNNSSFTAAQWSAINSGITSAKITGIDNALAGKLDKSGGTLTGNLSGPYVKATQFSSGEHVDDSYGPYSCTRGNDENENNGWCCYSFVRYQRTAFALGYDHSNSIILGTPATWNGGDGWGSKWLEVGASTFKYNSNNVYHAGNSNSTSVGWSASTLTLAGAISGATSIDTLLYFDTTNSRIGIGTSSPTEKLDIQGGSVLISPRGAEYLKISSSDVNIFLDGYDSDGWCNLSYRSNGTTRLFINGVNGRVGIGVAAPAYMIDVSGDIHASTNILADGYMSASKLAVSGTAGDGTYGISLYNGANYIHSYGIWSGLTSVGGTCGQVSGTWATYFTMEGATNRGWIFRYENTNVASISAGGVLYASAGIQSPGYGTFHVTGSSSDARLKDDIKTITPERAFAVLMALKPREWVWNGKSGELYSGQYGSGVVAQEAGPIIKDSVLHTGEYLHFDYNMLHGFEIAGLQSHENRIKELEKKVAMLEMENAELKAIIDA